MVVVNDKPVHFRPVLNSHVVKHSGARTCRVALRGIAGATTLDVEDDGRGPGEAIFGTGLNGLADRVQALGGTLKIEAREQHGFRLRVQLGSLAPTSPNGVHAG